MALSVVQRHEQTNGLDVHIASLRSTRSVNLLGTVMGVRRDGQWFTHEVEATGPDGRRVALQVVSRQRHTGGVTVRWDPSGMAESRFIDRRPWGLYAAAGLIVVGLAIGAWLLFG